MADEDDGAEPDLRDVAEPKSVKRKATRQKLREQEDEAFFRQLIAVEPGRRFLWSLLMDSMAFNPPFMSAPNGGPDGNATWFQAGKREFGLALYQKWLLVDPQAVAAMHAENDTRFAKR